MDKIQNDGLELCLNGTVENIKMKTAYSSEGLKPVDVLIILVKGMYTKEALAGTKNLIDSHTYVLTLQNGLGNTDNISELIPKEQILQGVMKITSQMTGPGKIKCNTMNNITAVYMGSVTHDEQADYVAKELVHDLNSIRVQAEFEDNIEFYIWSKAVNNISINSACGIVRTTIGNYCTHPMGRRILENCIKEVVAVAYAKGITLNYDAIMKSLDENTIPKIGTHLPSTAQDVKAKKVTEINYLNGAISKYGKALGIPTPMNDAITYFIHVIEDNYENQF